jgi:pheromone shutdown protein TraB
VKSAAIRATRIAHVSSRAVAAVTQAAIETGAFDTNIREIKATRYEAV